VGRRLIKEVLLTVVFAVLGGGTNAASSSKVAPDQPVTLAISRGGGLYIGDRGRNEILEWLPSSGLRIVARTGIDPGGLVATSDGTLYFTQAGRTLNTVIREVTPAGTSRTIAGLHPSCASGSVDSIPAESVLFHGASLSLTPSGALAVDADLCVGKTYEPEHLLLTSSGRFVEEISSVPAVAAVNCGSGVPGRDFHVFACFSGGGHPKELLVVRKDGSSVAYPGFRVGEFTVGDGEVVAAYDVNLVRVTSRRLVSLVTTAELARALHIRSIAIADIYAPTVDARGDIYFVASMSSRSGCQNRILERTAGGAIHQIWASSTSRSNTCG
jgi:hypothetical protein